MHILLQRKTFEVKCKFLKFTFILFAVKYNYSSQKGNINGGSDKMNEIKISDSKGEVHFNNMKSPISRFIKDLKKDSGLIFLALPGVILIFIFCYIPLYGLILPFKQYRYDLGFFKSQWSGFVNFKYLFHGNIVLRVVRNTICYNVVFIVLGQFLSVAFGLMLFELGRKSVKLYQTILFIPYFISWVVASFAFSALLDMEHGVLNEILQWLGKEPVLWYNEVKYWPFILVIVAVWKGLGYSSIIYYAALMGVDQELYEAARIDGASKLRQIRHISIPMLAPMITMMVILAIGRILNSDFGLFYNVPLNSHMLYSVTDVIDTFVYRSLMDLGDMGMASAAGFCQSVVGFFLVITVNYVVKKINSENSLF
jgi:putative aldouronate transport system permease protein